LDSRKKNFIPSIVTNKSAVQGYQAVSKGGSSEVPNIVLENMIKVTRACGGLGIPGLYVPTDPGAPDKASGEGKISLSFGKLFEKVCPNMMSAPKDGHQWWFWR
jgi:hypothetical protein